MDRTELNFQSDKGDGRPLTLAGIGLDLLGYSNVAAMLHRVAMAREAAAKSSSRPAPFPAPFSEARRSAQSLPDERRGAA